MRPSGARWCPACLCTACASCWSASSLTTARQTRCRQVGGDGREGMVVACKRWCGWAGRQRRLFGRGEAQSVHEHPPTHPPATCAPASAEHGPAPRLATIACHWRIVPSAPPVRPAGLLEALQSESPRSDGSTPSPTSKAEDEYAPPPEASLLADGERAAG